MTVTLDRCSVCDQPAHASETDDLDRCASCRGSAATLATTDKEPDMTTIKIATPAGRTLKLAAEAVQVLEMAGLVRAGYVSEEIDADVDQIVSGGSLAALLGRCQDGADDDETLGAWSDYAHEIVRVADNELLATQARA